MLLFLILPLKIILQKSIIFLSLARFYIALLFCYEIAAIKRVICCVQVCSSFSIDDFMGLSAPGH